MASVQEPTCSMELMDQGRPAVWVVPTSDVGIPAGSTVEPVPAPSAEVLALSGSNFIASLAKIVGSLTLLPKYAEQYGHHFALQAVKFTRDSALRGPS